MVRLRVPRRYLELVGKSERHRTTGCREPQLAKIVAGQLAARWFDALHHLEHMDLKKVAAGSLDLLGDGYLTISRAAETLDTAPSRLAALSVERKA